MKTVVETKTKSQSAAAEKIAHTPARFNAGDLVIYEPTEALGRQYLVEYVGASDRHGFHIIRCSNRGETETQ